MSAFNWIVFEHSCPVCGRSAEIRAQAHVAAAFAADKDGRFVQRRYALGDRMSWFPEGDPRHEGWRAGGRAIAGVVEEACPAICGRCGGALCAVLRFRALRATEVSLLVREEDWPRGFPRTARA